MNAKQSEEFEARAEEIYQGILNRAPEHDFDPTIDRTRRLVELLGDPHKSFRMVHLTGTNGKTSTSRMIESLVRHHGLRTGLFTSPHLTTVRERIQIDGEPISAERFVEMWEDIEPYVAMVDAELAESGQSQLSFFEVLTGLAFAAFADAPVDVAVVEVGMGGEWDSTNVADGDVAVITPIAMDHERWLGSTLAEIASTKAGIIKPGATVISAPQPESVAEVLLSAAAKAGARLVRHGDELEVVNRLVAVGGQLLDLRGIGGLYTEIFLPLHGKHQADNALLALAATEALMRGGGALEGPIVEEGFATTTSPGRLEVVRTSPLVIVDAAHNPAGAVALNESLHESFALERIIGVVAMVADKDAETFLGELEPLFDEIVITEAITERALPSEDLAEIAIGVFGEDRVHTADNLLDAIDLAAARAEYDNIAGTGVLITGSVITVAQARILFGVG